MMQTITIGPIGFAEKDGQPPYMASDFKSELDQADPSQTLYLDFHSEGGSVVEGYRMQQLIAEYPGHVVGRVRCMAFSIASYALMECDEIEIAENGYLMVHNPYSQPEGDAKELARQADFLGQLQTGMVAKYCDRTGLPPEEVQALLDEESYIGAQQAVELGFADRIIGKVKVARQPQAIAYREQIGNMPSLVLAALRSQGDGETEPAQRPEGKAVSAKTLATVADIKRAFPKAKSDFIVLCLEKEMAMGDVGEEYARAMEEENTELMARVTAMEEEISALKAMADPAAADDSELEEPAAYNNPGEKLGGGAKAQRPPGVNPVSHVAGGASAAAKDPQAEWNTLVDSYVAKGKSRAQAVIAANRVAPKLRESVVGAAN